jgi:hypothetical protein
MLCSRKPARLDLLSRMAGVRHQDGGGFKF